MRTFFKKIYLSNAIPPIVGVFVIGLVFALLNSQVILAKITYAQHQNVSTQTKVVEAAPEVAVDEGRIYIPKIEANLPVIYDQPSINEIDVQNSLKNGVLHYGQTAKPGEKGNVVVVGHSSGPIWREGEYKFAFTLLDKLAVKDLIYLKSEGIVYAYEVFDTQIVEPDDLSVLKQKDDVMLTLITCTPVGTNKQRLVVVARQVAPNAEFAKPLVGSFDPTAQKLPL